MRRIKAERVDPMLDISFLEAQTWESLSVMGVFGPLKANTYADGDQSHWCGFHHTVANFAKLRCAQELGKARIVRTLLQPHLPHIDDCVCSRLK